MSFDDLVCANCSGRVLEGRCPVCRESRDELHASGRIVSAVLLALAAFVFAAFIFALVRTAGA